MLISEIISEGLSHACIVVDVQPEYSGMNDGDENPIFPNIINFVNGLTGPVLMFVNAEDQGLTGDTVADIKQYWNDTICPEEDRYIYNDELDDYVENTLCPVIDWNRFTIVDKGYGYIRSAMDQGVPPAVIIKIIREMYKQKVNDSSLLFGGKDNSEYTSQIIQLVGYNYADIFISEPIFTEWTSIAQLKRFSNAYIVGGARNECLREVEILMNAFNIKYKRIDSLVY
jgi:hypothetical protein